MLTFLGYFFIDSFLFASMCNLWCAVYLPSHPHHREQLQQVLREGQDWGGDPSQEEESVLGGCKARSEYFIYYFFVYDNLYNNYMSHLLPLPLMVLIISMLKFVFKKLNVLYGVKLCILMPKISLC